MHRVNLELGKEETFSFLCPVVDGQWGETDRFESQVGHSNYDH